MPKILVSMDEGLMGALRARVGRRGMNEGIREAVRWWLERVPDVRPRAVEDVGEAGPGESEPRRVPKVPGLVPATELGPPCTFEDSRGRCGKAFHHWFGRMSRCKEH